MNRHYFNSIEEAEKFIKAYNVGEHHYETPLLLETGVDLVIHLTREEAVSILVNRYGWTQSGAKSYVDMHDSPSRINWKSVKNYKTHFKCEICGEETPINCEGREPNTCAMCMPLLDGDIVG